MKKLGSTFIINLSASIVSILSKLRLKLQPVSKYSRSHLGFLENMWNNFKSFWQGSKSVQWISLGVHMSKRCSIVSRKYDWNLCFKALLAIVLCKINSFYRLLWVKLRWLDCSGKDMCCSIRIELDKNIALLYNWSRKHMACWIRWEGRKVIASPYTFALDCCKWSS